MTQIQETGGLETEEPFSTNGQAAVPTHINHNISPHRLNAELPAQGVDGRAEDLSDASLAFSQKVSDVNGQDTVPTR